MEDDGDRDIFQQHRDEDGLRLPKPYALKELEYTNTQLGLVRTVGGLISIVLSLPAGMLSDRPGASP